MIYIFPNIKNIITLHNEYRKKVWYRYLPILKENSFLNKRANEHAEEMSLNKKLINDSSKIDIYSINNAINVAYDYKNEYEVMEYWITYKITKDNICSKSYNYIGCGYSFDKEAKIYWCVILANIC